MLVLLVPGVGMGGGLTTDVPTFLVGIGKPWILLHKLLGLRA